MYQVIFDNRDKTTEERTAEVQSKIDQYKAAQIFQLEHGGPGPVAEYEIMSIVNDHSGEFEIIIPPEPEETINVDV